MLWAVRLSLLWGEPWREVLDRLTGEDLALYMALVEQDGPFWGEDVRAHLRQLGSIVAAAGGTSIPPDDLKIDWHFGPVEDGSPARFKLLPAADGLAAFAARSGLDVVEEPAT